MKRAAAIFLILVLCLSVAACGERGVPAQNAPTPNSASQSMTTPVTTPDASAQNSPTAVVTAFFEAFADADYETMKTYCTADCVRDEFGTDGVYGMERASAVSIGVEELSRDQDDCDIQVTVELTPSANSRFAGQTQVTFFVDLELERGVWRIDDFDRTR